MNHRQRALVIDGRADPGSLTVAYDPETRQTSVTAPPVRPLVLTIDRSDDGFVLSWPSREGMRYNLRRNADLTGDVRGWTLVEGGMAATPDINARSISPGTTRMRTTIR